MIHMVGVSLVRAYRFEVEQKKGIRKTKEVDLNHTINIKIIIIYVTTIKVRTLENKLHGA